jgi:hypothetical protein
MGELINNCDSRAAIRWKLLASASALALTATISCPGIARAEDTDRPFMWIELGGQYDAVAGDGQQTYAPPFLSSIPASLPSPLPAQRLPGAALDWNGKISFEPDRSDWTFSVAVRYGRSSAAGHVEKVLPPTKISQSGYVQEVNYVQSKSYAPEIHTILDFAVGRDVGLGALGGTSQVSGGVRVAQFTSDPIVNITALPDYRSDQVGDRFRGAALGKHSFHGIGPALSWDASTPIAGKTQDGEITLDWGVNAALLFGRRTADTHHQTSQCHIHYSQFMGCVGVYTKAGDFRRSHAVMVPDLGGFAGLSMRYANAKISFGYRADEFFGAMDGGIDTAMKENVGFYGPFASVSVGLGG